jgi:BMFP domain-containing protein YqiC
MSLRQVTTFFHWFISRFKFVIVSYSFSRILTRDPTSIPTESLHAIQQRLDVLVAQATHSQQSALENAVMYTMDAVDDGLDAMLRTPVDPAKHEVLQKELELMAELLEELTDLEARRRVYLHSRSRRANNINAPTSGARQTSFTLAGSIMGLPTPWRLFRALKCRACVMGSCSWVWLGFGDEASGK